MGFGGIPNDGKEGRLHGLCYPWDQDTLGIADLLDDVPLGDVELRFTTVVKVQLRLATAHVKLSTHVLALLNHALGEHRLSRELETPNSLLRAIKLWYILPALLQSQDGRAKRHERFASVERGDITLLWLMGHTRRASARRTDPAREATDKAKLRASSACRHPGGVTVAARSLLAEPRAPGNEATWERVKAKFSDQDHSSIFQGSSGSGGSKCL